jgi:hypothetical protein
MSWYETYFRLALGRNLPVENLVPVLGEFLKARPQAFVF